MKNEVDELIKGVLFTKTCPIDLDGCSIWRLDVDKIIRFFNEHQESLKEYDVEPDYYSPLTIFNKIRERIDIHIKLQKNDQYFNLRKKLKEESKINNSYILDVNREIINKMKKFCNHWDKTSPQTAINVYHSLLLYIYSSNFNKADSLQSMFRDPEE